MNWTTIEAHLPNLVQKYMKEANIAFMKHLGGGLAPTCSTVGFGDIIPFEEHKYVFMTIVLPGLSFMSSLINSIVAYVEKISILNQNCFSIPKCLSEERASNSGIRADNFQQETSNVELAV